MRAVYLLLQSVLNISNRNKLDSTFEEFDCGSNGETLL